jgi:hypothetical protein
MISPKSELNIIKSMKLAHDINKIKLYPEHKFLALHIQDLYTYIIPIEETLNIVNRQLQNSNINKQYADIITLLSIILKQYYFQYDSNFCKLKTGIAMGYPVSGISRNLLSTENQQI